MATCPVCSKYTRLIDSHVYPRWFYEEYLKSERSGHVIVLHSDPNTHNKRCRTGFSEHLLCAMCDNGLLSHIETLAGQSYVNMLKSSRDFTYLRDGATQLDPQTGETIYRFAVSLAFRTALATGHFFDKISLEPEIIEKLISEFKRPNYQFHVLAIYRSDLGSVQALVEPEIITTHGARTIFLRFGIWQFFIFLERPDSERIPYMCLGNSGAWPLIWTTNPSDLELIRDLVARRHLHDQSQRPRRHQ